VPGRSAKPGVHRDPVRSLVCVHRAHVDVAGLTAGDADPEIIPAGRLRASLTGPGHQRSGAHVAALGSRAHTMLRPA
jgi:hypothetical protein